MNNIFENAKFGDKFVTRDGRMAIIVGVYCRVVSAVLENDWEMVHYYSRNDNGKLNYLFPEKDIVDKWQEEINEEELDRLAKQEGLHLVGFNGLNLLTQRNKDHADLHNVYELMEMMYKAGYRKAKGE